MMTTMFLWFVLPPLIAAVSLMLFGGGFKRVKNILDARKAKEQLAIEEVKQQENRQNSIKKAVRSLALYDVKNVQENNKDNGRELNIFDFLESSYYDVYLHSNGEGTFKYDRLSNQAKEYYTLTKSDLVFIQEEYPKMVNEIYNERASSHEIKTELNILDQVREATMRKIAFIEDGKKELSNTAQAQLEAELEALESVRN